MKIINLSEVVESLQTIVEQVIDDVDITIISRPNAPDAVIMSYDHYSSLIETLYLLGTPSNAAHLARSIQQARAGIAQCRNLIEG